MKNSIFASLAAGLLMILSSCDKNEDPIINTPTDPLAEWTLITTVSADDPDYSVKVYADGDLMVGYNRVQAKVYKNNQVVNDADVYFEPIMTMPTMSHSCPVEQPMYNATTKAYAGAITFIMPTGAMGTWDLEVHIEHDTVHTHAASEIVVLQPVESKLINFVDTTTSTAYFLALIEPSAPRVGINDFEVALYKRESMMDFPAVTGFSMAIEPEMPTMGHGSPNNVDPLDMGDGHYMGKVNFTMTGLWWVNIDVMDDQSNQILDGKYFVIDFQ